MTLDPHEEFNTLNYVIKKSDDILLFAHTHPDSDTIGSVLALKEYISRFGKNVDIACFDPFPTYLASLATDRFEFPARLDIKKYKLLIAADSVERGFHKIKNDLNPDQITVLIDHHPDITLKGDINIIDSKFSSTCQIIYDFFMANKIEISRKMATFLMLGIIGDTGTFQHSNTTPEVLEIASSLMKKGAPISKIVRATFSDKNICTLRLWGRAFDRARINTKKCEIAYPWHRRQGSGASPLVAESSCPDMFKG